MKDRGLFRHARDSVGSQVTPMTYVLIVTGLSGAAMLALGCNVLVPLSSESADLCDLIAVASMLVFCGLTDGR